MLNLEKKNARRSKTIQSHITLVCLSDEVITGNAGNALTEVPKQLKYIFLHFFLKPKFSGATFT